MASVSDEELHRRYLKIWRANNRRKQILYRRRSYAKTRQNPEQVEKQREYSKAYYWAHVEEAREYARKRREKIKKRKEREKNIPRDW